MCPAWHAHSHAHTQRRVSSKKSGRAHKLKLCEEGGEGGAGKQSRDYAAAQHAKGVGRRVVRTTRETAQHTTRVSEFSDRDLDGQTPEVRGRFKMIRYSLGRGKGSDQHSTTATPQTQTHTHTQGAQSVVCAYNFLLFLERDGEGAVSEHRVTKEQNNTALWRVRFMVWCITRAAREKRGKEADVYRADVLEVVLKAAESLLYSRLREVVRAWRRRTTSGQRN